jgi:hypothetical protein
MAFVLRLALALRLHAAVPALDVTDAYAHVEAAQAAATAHVSPELLLAIAYVESRYDPTATSRVEGTHRRTGRYPSTVAPAHLAVGASLYCGVLQTYAGSWDDCLALRALPAAYAAGAAELEQWLRDKRVRGDIALALAGHGCGNRGVTTGKCNAYPDRVLWIARRLITGASRVGRGGFTPS